MPVDKIDNCFLPAICHWDKTHFVVLEKVKCSQFYIIDPAKGRKKLSYKKFKQFYNDIILIPTKGKLFKNRKSKTKKKIFDYVKTYKKEIIYLLIITLFSQIILAMVPIFNKYIIDNISSDFFIDKFNFLLLILVLLFSSIFIINFVRLVYLALFQFRLESKDFGPFD